MFLYEAKETSKQDRKVYLIQHTNCNILRSERDINNQGKYNKEYKRQFLGSSVITLIKSITITSILPVINGIPI